MIGNVSKPEEELGGKTLVIARPPLAGVPLGRRRSRERVVFRGRFGFRTLGYV
jgi:hypothetical protein